MKFLIAASALLFFSVSTHAAQSLSTKISGNYSSLRPLGMGNAFTAVADDYSLIMYNPAGFARKQYNEVQITLVGAGVSSKTLTITKDITDASNITGTDNDKAQAISDVLAQYYGQALGGKVQALEMFWIRKNWGIALLPLDLTVDMSINRQLGPAIDLNVKGDTALAFGYGDAISKTIDAGITAKYIHRVSVEQSVSALELATDSNVLSENRFKEGTTFDFDIGFMYTPEWFNVASSEAPAPAVDVPPVADPAAAEPAKPEDKKPEDKKADEAKPTEGSPLDPKPADQPADGERKPQAEEAAAATAEQKPEEAPPLGTVILGDPKTDAKVDAKAAEAKTAEEKLKEEAKSGEKKVEDAKAAEEIKALDTAVKSNQEKYPLKFGVVVHNVIAGEFTLAKSVNKNATEAPSKNHRVIDVGSQYLLTDMEDFKIRAMVDFRNILHPEVTLTKSFHTGLEFDYSPSGWFRSQFRVGLNQMYYTAGATLLLGILNLEVATYGEEVGTEAQKIENRVLAAKLGLNF